MSERQPTEEEMRQALEEQMRRIRVEDVLVQTAVTLVNLGGRRLGLLGDPSEKDVEQARLAIDGVRALVPLLGGQDARAVRDALSQLQVAFAREAGAGAPASSQQSGTGAPARSEQPAAGAARSPQADEEAERAKARSKIWTPPGA